MRTSPGKLAISAFVISVIAISAQIKFNVGPVPYTMQNMGVTLAGLLLPPQYAFLSIFIYLLLIALGLPVASGGGGGVSILAGYTSGYLWGFAISAPLISFLTRIYFRKTGKDLITSSVKDIAVLLTIITLSFLPTYALGFIVFYRYSVPNSSLFSWSNSVAESIGFVNPSRFWTVFIASVLIFLPQDIFMDQLIGILLAKGISSFLQQKGLSI